MLSRELEELCILYLNNRTKFRKVFKLESGMTDAAGALCTFKGYETDVEEIKNCYKILKKNEGLFSLFRGNMCCPLVAKMCMSDDPEEYYESIKIILDKLNDNSIFQYGYGIMAAMIIYGNSERRDWDTYVSRVKFIYAKMKEDHSFLTSEADKVFAALLAVSNIDIDNLLLEMEESFNLLKGEFSIFSIQEMSQVLSLDMGSPGYKVQKVKDMKQAAKARKMNFGKRDEAMGLALMALSDLPEDVILDQVEEIYEYLKIIGAYKGLLYSKSEKLLIASMLFIKACRPNDPVVDTILLYVILANVIAAQAAAAAAA